MASVLSRLIPSQLSSPSGSPRNSSNGNKLDLISVLQSKKGRRDKFKELLNKLVQGDANVNARGEHGNTALHHAVLGGQEMCVKALIAFSADVNATNDFNMTPLDMAFKNQIEELVPLLVSVGCLTGDTVSLLQKPASFPTSSSTSTSLRRSVHSQSRSPTSSTTSGRRSVPRPQELPCCPAGTGTTSTGGQESAQPMELAGSPTSLSTFCTTPTPAGGAFDSISEELQRYIDERFDASSSLKGDEALAITQQLKEIHRCRHRKGHGGSPRATPSITAPVEFRSQPGGNRILCLDGGGLRGLIQIEILCELERMTGKRITELFDVIMGTSTGGILALGLVYKDMSLAQLRQLFYRLKDDIFSKTGGFGGYNTKALEELLKRVFGCELKMSDKTYPKVFVAAVNKSHTPLKLQWFNNCLGDEFSHALVWKVGRYTSAAPTFFSECDNYVDGGVLANNPCEAGLAHLQEFYHTHGTRLAISCMVSVGTGVCPKKELGSISGATGVQRLLRLINSAIGESEEVAKRCKHNCDAQNIPFYRFNPHLCKPTSPAETDSIKLIEMVIASRILMHSQAEVQMDKLVPLLTYSH